MTIIANQLNTLESAGLVRLAQAEPELEYLFRHALVQEAAYESLLRHDRRRLHQAVGEALERLYPDRLASRELAPVLAQHFHEAGDPRALHYFTLAGDAAASVYANAEAVVHYTHALEIARSQPGATNSALLLQLYTRRGRALELSGRYAEALDNYAEMEALACQRGDRALELAALMAHATIHVTPDPQFDAVQGRALLDRALALACELGDRRAEARVLWDLMRLTFWTGDMRETLEYGERSLALARELDWREQVAFTLHDFHRSCRNAGQFERAQAALDEARQLWRDLGNLPMLADALASTADILYDGGDLEPALAAAEEAVRISQTISNQWGQAYGRMMMGYVYLERGELSQAIEAMEDAIGLSQSAGLVLLEPRLRVDLAWMYGILGAIEEGREMVCLALAKARDLPLPSPTAQPRAIAMLARLEILDGNLTAAKAALNMDASVPGSAQSSAIALAESELALATHEYARAITLTDKRIARYRKTGSRIYLVSVLHLKGQALLGQGLTEAAYDVLQEARATAEAVGSRLRLWPILLTLSQVEAQRGNDAEAHALRRQAREVIATIADHVPRPDLRASFLSLPLVQAALADEPAA